MREHESLQCAAHTRRWRVVLVSDAPTHTLNTRTTHAASTKGYPKDGHLSSGRDFGSISQRVLYLVGVSTPMYNIMYIIREHHTRSAAEHSLCVYTNINPSRVSARVGETSGSYETPRRLYNDPAAGQRDRPEDPSRHGGGGDEIYILYF